MPTEQESFWNANSYAVVTDKSKPAMKWTINALNKKGKRVSVVDMSDDPEEGTFKSVSELPEGIENMVIGLTKSEPANVLSELENSNIKRYWVHQATNTPKVEEWCGATNKDCSTGKCPMMYLSEGIGMHTIHRGINKLRGKY